MKLTYIFHSGFALETENCMLVFDYWLDPAHVIDWSSTIGWIRHMLSTDC